MVFSGAALPAAHCCLKVGPLGPADGAAEGAELGCGAPGATQGWSNIEACLKSLLSYHRSTALIPSRCFHVLGVNPR